MASSSREFGPRDGGAVMREQRYALEGMSRRPATYEDLIAVPEHLVAEIIDGELVTSPRPAPRHADAGSGLVAALRPAFDRGGGGPGGWRILGEPELHLGNDVLVPDIAGWRRERLPQLPAVAYFPLAPDWVCEVLSPSTAALDRGKKLEIYAREGVLHAWLVDPLEQRIEVLRCAAASPGTGDDTDWTLIAVFAGHESIRAEPFELIEIDLQLLWEIPG
jgi:Uma2 family endonuclease